MIRISPVRVITAAGEQLGVLPIEEALAAAQDRGLDLVEVAPTARPPVVKIMDYGKYKFEEAKAARAAKKKQHIILLKEVKYRPGIDDHDFDFKTRHAREFLGDGNKVKVTMMFRGRQIAHLELGRAVKVEAGGGWSSWRWAGWTFPPFPSFPPSNGAPMPKQKTKRAAMKRFKKTGTGKLKRWHANHTHILTKKTRKRKNRLKKGDLVSSADFPRVSRLLQA